MAPVIATSSAHDGVQCPCLICRGKPPSALGQSELKTHHGCHYSWGLGCCLEHWHNGGSLGRLSLCQEGQGCRARMGTTYFPNSAWLLLLWKALPEHPRWRERLPPQMPSVSHLVASDCGYSGCVYTSVSSVGPSSLRWTLFVYSLHSGQSSRLLSSRPRLQSPPPRVKLGMWVQLLFVSAQHPTLTLCSVVQVVPSPPLGMNMPGQSDHSTPWPEGLVRIQSCDPCQANKMQLGTSHSNKGE